MKCTFDNRGIPGGFNCRGNVKRTLQWTMVIVPGYTISICRAYCEHHALEKKLELEGVGVNVAEYRSKEFPEAVAG